MEKPNKPNYPGSVEKKAEVATPPIKATINYIRVQSLVDAHFKYTGRVSGKLYEWPKAGSIVAVQEEDVSDLLSKRLGARSCCGGEDTNKIFQLAI